MLKIMNNIQNHMNQLLKMSYFPYNYKSLSMIHVIIKIDKGNVVLVLNILIFL